MLDSCWTLPVEYIPTEWAGSPPPPIGYTAGGEPVPVMISTLAMHVKYGRSTNMSDNTSWRPAPGPRRVPEPWRSVWRSGYDGPWSSTSDRSVARNSLEKAPEPTRSRSSVDIGSPNFATERLRKLRLRARGRYRRALNVSEASQADSVLLPSRQAVELDRLDEVEDESPDAEDRPPIPYTTCPKSAPAILLSQDKSLPEPFLEVREAISPGWSKHADRLHQPRPSLPARSLSSHSYRGLPLYNARKGIVAEKIRSLGAILRRSDSSSHSTMASDFRPAPDAKERRRQARDPYVVHSKSVASSPLLCSPNSERASSPNDTPGGVFDPLVRAGILVATGELDRLTFLANSRWNDSNKSDKEPSTTSSATPLTGNAPPNTPAACLGTSSSVANLLRPTDGVLAVAGTTTLPLDSAMPAPSGALHSTEHGHRGKGAWSRLSDVHSPEGWRNDVQLGSASESGSVLANFCPQSEPGASFAGNDADKYEHHDVHHSFVPKLLSVTSPPPSDANESTQPYHSARLGGSSATGDGQKNIDIERLNELLDNAISDYITQRAITSTSSPANHAGAQFPERPILRPGLPSRSVLADFDAREPRQQPLPLGSLGIRPLIDSRASSPGPRREISTRQHLTSLSAASPVIKRHMAKHVARSTTPTESHIAPRMADECNPDHGNERPGDLELSWPGTQGDALRHEQRAGPEVDRKRTRFRRSTSGTVFVMEAGDGSSSDTRSSDSENPLADDGCPQEFATSRAIREQLQCIMPGTLPEERDLVDC